MYHSESKHLGMKVVAVYKYYDSIVSGYIMFCHVAIVL